MEKVPSVCLNMIVKNEAKIIRRFLDTVYPYIDSYCICDTGSTDATVEVIRSFFDEEKGGEKKGKIIHEPFRDFGYNRTFALQACEDITEGADYILLMDADMKFVSHLDPLVFRQKLVLDVYHLFQGCASFFYKNARILRNRIGCTYWGVTHEYVNAPEGTYYGTFERDELFIDDVGDGGCKDDKCARDIRLLLGGLEQHPNNDRYTFYLANSYSDSGQYDLAIQYYQKRIDLGGWVEEVWYSHYNMAKCYANMKRPADAVYQWMEALQVFPERMENVYELVRHYRDQGHNEMAYHFYQLAVQIRTRTTRTDFLFLQQNVYDYLLDYELSIIGYYGNPAQYNMSEVCMKCIAQPGLDDMLYRNVLSNYKFYAPVLSELHMGTSILASLPVKEYPYPLVSSTPTICMGSTPDEVFLGIRYVNYRIDDQGNYVNQDHIITKTWIVHQKNSQIVNQFEFVHDATQDGYYVGPEDLRIMYHQGQLYYHANRAMFLGDMCVEHGEIPWQPLTVPKPRILRIEGGSKVEKNWVMIPPPQGTEVTQGTQDPIKCIYKWSPLTIGVVEDNKLVVESRQETVPRFFQDVRGSTNGVHVGDEIWFICHLVSYEDRRYYYHLVVALDAATLLYKRHSVLFTFEKESKVEYTLGFIVREQHMEIGYSVMDRTTQFMTIPLSKIPFINNRTHD